LAYFTAANGKPAKGKAPRFDPGPFKCFSVFDVFRCQNAAESCKKGKMVKPNITIPEAAMQSAEID
jgi:hypothetical protein